MSYRVTCVRCKQEVRIPRELRDRWLTCPRCLASIPNPALSDVAAGRAPAPAAPDTPPPAVLQPRERSCPDCGRPVESSWRYCPHCDAPLEEGAFLGPKDTLEGDVRRDTSAVGIGLGLLGLLGGGGMIFYYCGGGLSCGRARGGAGPGGVL